VIEERKPLTRKLNYRVELRCNRNQGRNCDQFPSVTRTGLPTQEVDFNAVRLSLRRAPPAEGNKKLGLVIDSEEPSITLLKSVLK